MYFEDESTPVSLGILLDASGSMGDNRGVNLNRAHDLISGLVTRDLEAATEWMLARFTTVVVAQEWTTDRAAIVQPLRETRATGNARAAIAGIADELRHQYLLSYSTNSARDRRPHAIRVDVRVRGARVSARGGVQAH